MKAIAVNGSPRKTWNTTTLLSMALEGAKSAGVETERVHLYELRFTGCTSCFACKKKGNTNLGVCSMKDGISDILIRISTSDVLLLGNTARNLRVPDLIQYKPIR